MDKLDSAGSIAIYKIRYERYSTATEASLFDAAIPARPVSGPRLRRTGRQAVRRGSWRRLLSPLLLIVVWQAACSTGLLPPRILASPARIAATAASLTFDGELPVNLAVSLARVATGLAIAVLLGSGLALLSGLSRRGEDAIDPPLQMVRTLPHLALVPLFILWFGIGETPKVALVVLGALFPIYLNLYAGIRGIDPRLIELARTLRLDRWQTIRHVVLPGAIAPALVGLRTASGMAWLSLVVGEQINASSGIGFMMMDARDFMRTDIILVGLFVYAGLGLLTDGAIRALERRALRWRIAA